MSKILQIPPEIQEEGEQSSHGPYQSAHLGIIHFEVHLIKSELNINLIHPEVLML